MLLASSKPPVILRHPAELVAVLRLTKPQQSGLLLVERADLTPATRPTALAAASPLCLCCGPTSSSQDRLRSIAALA